MVAVVVFGGGGDGGGDGVGGGGDGDGKAWVDSGNADDRQTRTHAGEYRNDDGGDVGGDDNNVNGVGQGSMMTCIGIALGSKLVANLVSPFVSFQAMD